MSTLPHEVASTTDDPLASLLFDYPDADIVIRSQDPYYFRVPKIYIVNSSPLLGELVRRALDSPGDANAEASLPVVQLPKRGEIIHCLLTHIFPVSPFVPSTPEDFMELLSVAQTYQMDFVLTRIRDRIARHHPPPTRLEPALRIYALAQKYGLRPEALQAARIILNYPFTIEDLDNSLDIMPGASLYELWKYHERVRAILASDLTGFRTFSVHGTITDVYCAELSPYQIPSWLDDYIESIRKSPNLFDSAELNIAIVRHTKGKAGDFGCECASISSQTIRNFWEALASVFHGSFEKAESALSLVRNQENLQAQINLTTPPLKPFDVPDANIIIRSSDLVDFRVHKPVLAMASPFFKDLLSLPQPPDSEFVDGLLVVQLSEDSELLNGLVSMLYPVAKAIPKSYEKVLYLLAACQKYEMVSVQSTIRAEVKRGEFPAPKGVEAFAAYAIASAKKLNPEMEDAARLTLDHPMTFEVLGEALRLFEGWALRDLVNFRKRCRDNLVTCLDPFSKIPPSRSRLKVVDDLLLRTQKDLKCQMFTHSLDIHSRMRQEHITTFQKQVTCHYCFGTHSGYGPVFCTELEIKLAHAQDKVRIDRISHLGLV